MLYVLNLFEHSCVVLSEIPTNKGLFLDSLRFLYVAVVVYNLFFITEPALTVSRLGNKVKKNIYIFQTGSQ
jgi:hypothetical protein